MKGMDQVTLLEEWEGHLRLTYEAPVGNPVESDSGQVIHSLTSLIQENHVVRKDQG